MLDVSAQLENLGLITVAVCFDDTRIRAGEVHNQSFFPYPDNRSRVQTLEATGDPQHLAQVAADWFEHVMARPVERRVWLRNGRIAYEYAFCDTDTGLCRGGVDIGAFSGPPDRVIHARGTHANSAT